MDGAAVLTTGEIRAVFEEEIAGLGGRVEGFVEGAGEAFARSRLPWTREVGRRDRVFGGVALCAGPEALCVRPYIFRVVCKNGAVMARAMEAATIERGGAPDEEADLREAIRVCGSEAAFVEAAGKMEGARDIRADVQLNLMLYLTRHPFAAPWVREILRRFMAEGDRSGFGLLNAVTSVARDRREPRARWDLEELGGEIAYLCAAAKAKPRRAARVMAGA